MTACPTPAKSRYATQTASDRAGRHSIATVGRHLSPYQCRCGWWHLTKIAPKGKAQ